MSNKQVEMSPIEDVVAAIARGEMIVMVDDEDRENEGDLIMAAQFATAEKIAFIVRHTSGVVVAPLSGERCDDLRLPLMVDNNTESHRTAFTISVDLMEGTTTGISAADRAATLRALADPSLSFQSFARPGHIFPLRARNGGVLKRAGHTEAGVDLARLAGCEPAAIICEIQNDDGTMMRLPGLREFCAEHNLLLSSIAQLIEYRRHNERLVERMGEATVPTEFGSFTVGESGGALYQVLYQKKQNDRENWNMIDSSFITTLPDTWAINKRFVMLAINRWNDTYERVLLGGMTCDSDDYYNSEQNMNAVYLPKYNKEKPLYIGFFNTGAYQETIGGFGGLHHCLIPQPKHILIDRDENGILATEVFSEEQKAEDIMGILGYKKK